MCINDSIVERKKKPPKGLENFHSYSTSKEHYPKNVYYFVIAAIRKRFDQPYNQTYIAMQNVLLMSCKGKDSQQEMNSIIYITLRQGLDISKFVSQLKLSPSLFKLKDNDIIDMSTIIKKLQDMSRNRHLLTSKKEKIVRLFLLSAAKNAEYQRIFSSLKRVKTYLRSTMGNNRLHALILMHAHKNILEKINLAYITNEFVDRKGSRKQILGDFCQNYSVD